jgi:hypothetical protein
VRSCVIIGHTCEGYGCRWSPRWMQLAGAEVVGAGHAAAGHETKHGRL